MGNRRREMPGRRSASGDRIPHPGRDLPRYATAPVAVVSLLLVVLLLLLSNRYGPHRDELYFVSAGVRLAWGYPDQPSLTPALAALATHLAPGSLVVLRLPSALAVAGIVACAAGFGRLLGGGRAAQVLAAVTVAASAVVVAVGHRLSTATFDTLAWAAILLVVGHALHRRQPRLRLLAGLIAGIALHNKHGIVVLIGALLVALACTRAGRRQLLTAHPWVGAGIALLLWTPNLAWQAAHGWPALALGADIAAENAGVGGRLNLLLQMLVMFSPLIAVVWIYGLVRLVGSAGWGWARPIGLVFLVTLAVYLAAGGKGYYLAGAIIPLVSAGCVGLAVRWRAGRLGLAGVALALSAAVAWPAMIPVLPARAYAESFYPALDQDQLETIGWPELAGTVRDVIDDLPAEQRDTAVVFTQNYGEAGALEWYGIDRPVYSGHNGWGYWGVPAVDAAPVVAVGFDEPGRGFSNCRAAAVIENDAGAENEEWHKRIWVCDGPRAGWAALAHLSA